MTAYQWILISRSRHRASDSLRRLASDGTDLRYAPATSGSSTSSRCLTTSTTVAVGVPLARGCRPERSRMRSSLCVGCPAASSCVGPIRSIPLRPIGSMMASAATRRTLITAAATVLAAALGAGASYLANRDQPAAGIKPISAASATSIPTPEGTGILELELPGNGNLPWTDIDVRVKRVSKQPLDEVWVGVHNKNDRKHHWNFYPCGGSSLSSEYICRKVVVGEIKDKNSTGPWTIAAVVVDPSGASIITEHRPALVSSNLLETFGSSVKAYGAQDAHR